MIKIGSTRLQPLEQSILENLRLQFKISDKTYLSSVLKSFSESHTLLYLFAMWLEAYPVLYHWSISKIDRKGH